MLAKQNSAIKPNSAFGMFAPKASADSLKIAKKNSIVTRLDITLRTSRGKYLNVDTATNTMPASKMNCIAFSTTFTKKDSESKISPCSHTYYAPILQEQTSLLFYHLRASMSTKMYLSNIL